MRTAGGIKGISVGPNQITTSTASTATAYGNQRKIDLTSNGVLWVLLHDGLNNSNSMRPYYSLDNGATWALTSNGNAGCFGFSGSSYGYTPNWSFFIDVDDYAHVVYKDQQNGYIYYRRGTPNADRTAWTWSAATLVWNTNNTGDYPDIVAHREGDGWVAHIVFGATDNSGSWYKTVTISSSGTFTVSGNNLLAGSYAGSTSYAFASLDFHHTGDGKTVKDGTPHLYVAWSAGATGAGKGIRFKKASYAAGAWTWGTEREIDNTRFWNSTYPSNWLNCLFDGTRVIIGGKLRISSTDDDLVLYERDEGDTNTIVHVLLNDAPNTMEFGSLSYDADGNVYLLGRHYDGVGQTISYRKWDQALDSLGPVILIANTSTAGVYCSAKRGYSDSKIEFIYTDGTASPYNINYGAIK